MDTFRKWLNKPKADDKSLLARFYHADRSLTAITSELDSFDGRAEPDRCSRLVSRLRQGQDKVLAITNLIMEELLGEDRDPRAFRAKFPEEVLQENLAGQLWFGAECLAAGSSIMNREQESKEMRPLAQAVTRSLGNVRNLLRDQCLRNNVPNSKTLHLDVNDSTTEQLYESLKIFDRLFAEFELRYVSAMVPVKTKHEYEMQEFIAVLFSETLQRALKISLLDQEKVDAFDPALMFSIPRLAIVSGLVIYPDGPLDMNMPSDELSEMFRPFRTILIKIRDLLNALDRNELFQLEKLLCTNEDINTTVPVGTSSIEAPCPEQQSTTTTTTTTVDSTNKTNCDANHDDDDDNDANPTTNAAQVSVTSSLSKVLRQRQHHQPATRYNAKIRSPSISSVSANSSLPSTPSLSPIPSPTLSNSLVSTASSAAATSTTSAADFSDNDDMPSDDEFRDDDDDDDDDVVVDVENEAAALHDDDLLAATDESADIMFNDCATGYLISNTNLGNLLQPQAVALNGNFVASEDELASNQDDNLETLDEDVPTSSSRLRRMQQTFAGTSQNNNNNNNDNDNDSNSDIPSNSQAKPITTSATTENEKTASSCRHSHHHHHHHRRSRHHHHHHHHHRHHQQQEQQQYQHSKLKRCHQGSSSSSAATLTNEPCSNSDCHAKSVHKSPAGSPTQHHDTSSVDSHTSATSSQSSSSSASPTSLSAVVGDATKDTALMALRANRRLKFKSTESLLHRLFVCIAGVADQLQTNFASDLRQILRSVFLMNMSIMDDDEIDIPEKTKESELFEFRASENDVIQESSNGSNQSIYSAEEVNPELDNVFNNSSNSNNNNNNNNNSNNSRSSSMSSTEDSMSNNHNNSNHTTIRHSTGSSGIQRVATIDLGTNESQTNLLRNHVERSRSLGDHEQQQDNSNHNINNNNNHNSRNLSAYISGRRMSASTAAATANSNSNNNGVNNIQTTTTTATRHQQRNRNNSVCSNSPGSSSSSSSESNSPIIERANGQNSLAANTAATRNNNNHINASATVPTTASTTCLAPPAWIPDDKAPRCMSCRTQFTAFRRRHHCRNCGGVFCSVCSNASAPLPKYGLTKAVRVCRECYVREVRGAANASLRTNNSQTHLAATTHHQTANTATAGGS